MARITVLGGTGYVGSNIAAVAADRGHEVVARKQVRLKQGFVAVAIAARRGATYRLTFARP